MDKELVVVPRATLDIYNYKIDDLNIYEFNATECSPPEPMVNTILVLEMLKNDNDRLVVIFFHEPFPLYERLAKTFSYESKELQSGDVKVTFKRI